MGLPNDKSGSLFQDARLNDLAAQCPSLVELMLENQLFVEWLLELPEFIELLVLNPHLAEFLADQANSQELALLTNSPMVTRLILSQRDLWEFLCRTPHAFFPWLRGAINDPQGLGKQLEDFIQKHAPPPSRVVEAAPSRANYQQSASPEPAPSSQGTPSPQQTKKVQRWRRTAIIVAAVVLLLASSGVATGWWFWFGSPQATTVTLTLARQGYTDQFDVQGRLLTKSQSGQQPGSATGSLHQDAAIGHGLLTFYNFSTVQQVVPAGTYVSSKSGVEVVTLAVARVPPGNGLTNGTVQVPAQAVNAGSLGNIQADDIFQDCCLKDIKVRNETAFIGGQDQGNLIIVTQADVNRLAATIHLTTLSDLQSQVGSEGFTTPDCHSTVRSSPSVGKVAPQGRVTVTLQQRCTTIAYDRQRFQQSLSQRIKQRFGANYVLRKGAVVTVVGGSNPISGQPPTLHVTVQEGVVYVLTSSQRAALLKHIAGLSAPAARLWLLRQPGIVSVVIDGPDLPSNPDSILLTVR